MDNQPISKACDECKRRKVKCEVPLNDSSSCTDCKKWGIVCRFSPEKKRGRPPSGTPRRVLLSVARPSGRVENNQIRRLNNAGLNQPPKSPNNTSGKLFVDHLLEGDLPIGGERNGISLLKAHDSYVGSSNIGVFSDKMISSIDDRLGHQRFHTLFLRLSESMNARARRDIRSTNRATNSGHASTALQPEVKTAFIREYCGRYFQYVDPIYPFLHREEFEKRALGSNCRQLCERDPAFAALFYTILALGCQHEDGGAFQPGQGKAWSFFQVALSRFTDIVTSKERLVHAQAMTAMAIFSRNVACVQIEKLLTTEAARIAQALGINRAIYEDTKTDECRRTFWVIYILEKTQCFACGRDSIFNDANISTPIPQIPETPFTHFNIFRVLCRLSRLLSRAQNDVFSISATLLPRQVLIATIEKFELELESWKASICGLYRPDDAFLWSGAVDPASIEWKIRISFHYYSVAIALTRLKMNILPPDAAESRKKGETKLLKVCRSIIDLLRLISVKSYTPIWILLSVPLSAIFIIFDFIIHNPLHPDTKNNLALLGVASGYFSGVELASNDLLQTSLLSELSQIAREYINQVEARGPVEVPGPSNMPTPHLASQEDGHRSSQLNPSPLTDQSFQQMQDEPQTYGNMNGNMAPAIHGDPSVPSVEPASSDGVDLTSLFAAEVRDFFDGSVVDLF